MRSNISARFNLLLNPFGIGTVSPQRSAVWRWNCRSLSNSLGWKSVSSGSALATTQFSEGSKMLRENGGTVSWSTTEPRNGDFGSCKPHSAGICFKGVGPRKIYILQFTWQFSRKSDSKKSRSLWKFPRYKINGEKGIACQNAIDWNAAAGNKRNDFCGTKTEIDRNSVQLSASKIASVTCQQSETKRRLLVSREQLSWQIWIRSFRPISLVAT